LKSTARLKRWK